MRIALVLLFLFLLILFMPIKLRSKIDFNVFINEGIFSLFFFKLKVILAKLEFQPFKILVKTKKQTIPIYLFSAQRENNFVDLFFDEFLHSLSFNNAKFISRFGIMQDCMLSSVGCGCLLNAFSLISCQIAQNKKRAMTSIYCSPDYNYNTFIVCLSTSITFNIFILLKCLVVSIVRILLKEGKKNGK